MADVFDQLKAALSDRYEIEREIGSGGMATVYLARDLKHERRVAVKVLRPELAAALGSDRFHQEIKIAANLHHPHILPLYDSGEADGVLYYVMPYEEGQSLRDKLAHVGELPIAEAVRILRDVVDALDHAHKHGVVHRDIKPDNIMLSERHALVTDFGVAKAVSEATGVQQLTTEGVALGTPAYMSPEQASAAKRIDHRADIYAVGALAYELLAGRPPFVGTTPQEVVAAHVTRDVELLTEHRSTVPPELAQLVMRCLEKKPADRWQSAEDLLRQLEALATPSGGITPTGTQPVGSVDHEAVAHRAHPVRVAGLYAFVSAGVVAAVYGLMLVAGLPNWVTPAAIALLVVGLPFVLATGFHERRRAMELTTGMRVPTPTGVVRHFTWPKALAVSGVAFAALAVGTGAYMAMRAMGVGPAGTLVSTGVLEDRGRLLVAQFENRTADSGLGISITAALRIDLQQSPVVRVVGSDAIAPALERMGRPRDTTVDLELAREIAEREGMRAVVAGEIGTLGSSFVLSVRVIAAADGAELVALRETASDEDEIITALDRLSARLRERIGESFRSIRQSVPLERVSTSSLEALRLYSRGVAAEDSGDYVRALQLLQDAVALDSNFAMAFRTLSIVLENSGAPDSRQHAAATRAYELRDRLPPVEHYLTEANYYQELENDRDKTIAAYRSVLEIDPEHVSALNNLAVELITMRRWAEAEEQYKLTLLAGDSAIWQAFQGVCAAQFAQGDTAAAWATLEAFGAKLPGHPEFHFVSAAAATAALDYPATFAHLEAMREAGRGAVTFEREWATYTARSHVALGRLAEAERISVRREAQDRERGDTDEALFHALRRASWTSQFRNRTDEAATLLNDALERYPLAEMPVQDRPYHELIQAYAHFGRPVQARGLYEEWESDVPVNLRSVPEQHRSRGLLALSEGDPAAALESFRAYYDAVFCYACALYPMGRAYDALGHTDSAVAVLSRGLDINDPYRYGDDPLWRAATLIRVGELHEERGDTDAAIARYNQLIELWSTADPELQEVVQDIRSRIARLVEEPRR